jgi:hypothetical protein
MNIPEDTAKAVFDIAVGSLDFGSGFLDDEQVERLREYAVLIGVNPWEATPENHKPKYCPGHVWEEHPGTTYPTHRPFRRCTVCHHYEYLKEGL